MDERFRRAGAILGDAAMKKLSESRVAVLGLGGVGSWCAEALCRSGVGTLYLLDQDTVSLSNVNRQLFALTSTLDLPKAEAAAARLRDIAPESRMQGVILSETARRPSCGRRRLFRGKADRRNRCGTTRQAAPADTQAGIPRIQKPWSGPNGSGKRCGAAAGDGVQATDNKRQALDDGRRNGRRTTGGEGMGGGAPTILQLVDRKAEPDPETGLEYENAKGEAVAAARLVRRLLGTPVSDGKGGTRPARYADIVVLRRSVAGVLPQYLEAFGKLGLFQQGRQLLPDAGDFAGAGYALGGA